jgi:pilus assembly protein FimV
MGDIEGAKSILEEVSSEGSEAQKKEAQELINGLGS